MEEQICTSNQPTGCPRCTYQFRVNEITGSELRNVVYIYYSSIQKILIPVQNLDHRPKWNKLQKLEIHQSNKCFLSFLVSVLCPHQCFYSYSLENLSKSDVHHWFSTTMCGNFPGFLLTFFTFCQAFCICFVNFESGASESRKWCWENALSRKN